MAVLEAITPSQSVVIGITAQANAITGGLFELPLIAPVDLMANTVYHLAVYNQVNGSEIGGRTAGLATTIDAAPINFRTQNLTGFTLGDTLDTSDESLELSPWIAGY
jgi:hypothetical protein